MITIIYKPVDSITPPLVTDQETIDSLPLLYRLLAGELIKKGRIVVVSDVTERAGEDRPRIYGDKTPRDGPQGVNP